MHFLQKLITNREKLLFFLCILFLPTQLGLHLWPSFSYIYSLRIDYLSPTIYFWDLLLTTLMVVWILRTKLKRCRYLTVILFFLLTQVVSLVFALNPGAGLVRFEQYFLAGAFFLYISNQTLRQIKKPLFWGILMSSFFESLLAICQFILNGSLGLWVLGERAFTVSTPSIANFNFYGHIFLRPYATFSHPNVLGAFLVLAIILLIYLKPYFRYNFLVNLVITLSMVAAILTFSRPVIFVLLLELIFLLRNKLKQLIILVTVFLPFVLVRFSSAFNFDILSYQRREELAYAAYLMFVKSPIFGIGLNNFMTSLATNTLISGPNRFIQPVHNIFLLSLAETGLVGFVGFTTFLIFSLKQAISKKPLLLGILVIILLGMFDHYLLTLPQGQRLLFLFLALAMLK